MKLLEAWTAIHEDELIANGSVLSYIRGAWYSQLEDYAYFQSVKTDGCTIFKI